MMKRFSWVLVCVLVGLSSASVKAEESKTAPASPAGSPSSAPDLSFDDLLPPTDTTTTTTSPALNPPVDDGKVKARRLMLTLHQTVGIGLAVGMAGSMITGQLNYNDKFLHDTERNSGRYQLAHQAFVYPTLGLAALTAGLAIFAPVPIEKQSRGGFDRMTLHKIGQFTAFAGWAAQLGLGLYAASREGYANQQNFAAAHLAVGYVTLAGVLLGLGSIVF